MNDIF
jgi:hypothetical protein